MNICSQNTKARPVETGGTKSRRWLRAGLKVGLIAPMVGSGILLAGCARLQKNLTLDSVGPSPVPSVAATTTNGALVVYSAMEVNPNLSPQDSSGPNPYYGAYSRYKILTPDGKLLKSVENDSDTIVAHPQRMELLAGRYWVIARADGYGRVTVPVLVRSGQSTVLHLERDGFWPEESAFNETNAVRLPNGQIVGWRAMVASAGMP